MTRAFPRAAALLLTGLAFLAGCDDDDSTSTPTADAGTEAGTIVEVASGDDRFETLVAAVTAADLVDTLNGEGPFTVFAPTDDAFALIPEADLEALLADPEALSAVLLAHVVPGRLTAADVAAASTLTTVGGDTLTVEVVDGAVKVGGSTVIVADVAASNGVIHAIDRVILAVEPEPELKTIAEIAAETPDLSTLVGLVGAAGLGDELSGPGTFTVFAPTNAAFEAVGQDTLDALAADPQALTAVLLYHALGTVERASDLLTQPMVTSLQGGALTITAENGEVRINGALVVMADIEASNGVVHVIDAVLLPPQPEPGNIVEVADNAGIFTTLLAAAEAAGLVETLTGEGPYTVFAPTDEAFAALGQATIDGLLADPEALRNILLFHVVPGRLDSAAVAAADTLTSAQGSDIDVTVAGETVQVSGATITTVDVAASNGIIHIIDAVMLPPEPQPQTIIDVATGAGGFSTLLAAVDAAGLTATLEGEGPFTVFAPTDAAFAALGQDTINGLLADIPELTTILTYHVVPGRLTAADILAGAELDTVQGARLIPTVENGGVRIGNVQITMTDIEASNGIIHVLDAVLLPPGNIAEVAAAAGGFTTLLTAVEAADLTDALTGSDPLTVFAPTDAAFAALGEDTINALLADPPALANILLYHVTAGRLFASDVVAAASIPTLSAEGALTVEVSNGVVRLNGVQVVMTDIQARNGVIHVLDAVIVPR